MDEQSWFTSTDPQPMLDNVCTQRQASDRKIRRFAAACWHLGPLADNFVYQPVIAAMDAYAENHITHDACRATYATIWHAFPFVRPVPPVPPVADETLWNSRTIAGEAAEMVTHFLGTMAISEGGMLSAVVHGGQVSIVSRAVALRTIETGLWRNIQTARPRVAELLRHIIGNPFNPYPAPAHWPTTVVQLATSFYNGQDCSFALHDALLEAGHTELAKHFKEEALHPKGCYVLDLILGKK